MYKIGIADTTFARYDMAKEVIKTLDKFYGQVTYQRYVVPGIKDLPVASFILFEKYNCDLVIALGMPGPKAYDKASAQIASEGLMMCQLKFGKHILEVFVHEDEGSTDYELKQIMQDRSIKHTFNAVYLLTNPQWLVDNAGRGKRQGFTDAKAIE